MSTLVFQSDFGLGDGAVSAMHGVSFMVNPDLTIDDLTHEIEPYNIFEASYRILQTIGIGLREQFLYLLLILV